MPFPAFDPAQYSSPEFTRYAAVHASPKGPGDSRPTAEQIIKDEGLNGKLAGKTILITGCSSGIGIETVRALKLTGARIFATVRDLEKGKKALGDILEPGKVELSHLDLNSLTSVRKFAAEFLAASNNQLNILINNAGIMSCPEGTTEDGFELQVGTCHLAHFLLFQLVKPALLASTRPDFHSRVVSVASMAHRYFPPKLDNFQLRHGEYHPEHAYAHAKTANIWFANYIERHYGAKGLHGLSLHPGVIFTALAKFIPEEQFASYAKDPVLAATRKTPEQGAATTVWAAVAHVWEGRGGLYLDDCQVSKPVEEGWGPMESGYVEWTYDPEGEERLWVMSNELVGFKEAGDK
ncbi:hypothetical protein AA0113_g668 [Alternaria arborescens]|uniref:Short-chain dehydrogenase n=1 Tax=Alternaria arborescens TaxID=156630 RepID=A0A4Q4SRF3_9PLEO|nr:hypothetical protein AA0111_g10151 [Alternaria arborescens]RYO20469.1 hypothetical protein AA0111_g10151 [Alternaria arborescens]RYO72929.1 hypothetical protein AA0113_g668 [Alternaria arborescens]